MSPRVTAAITAIQGHVPDFVLSNQVLETMVDTNDAWITERTGIKERRILKGKDQGLSVMAVEAVRGLCTKRGIDPLEIDLLICCTVTADMQFPATANIICDKVGAKKAWGFDLNAACSGFLYGLTTGSQFIETGKYKKVVVVGGDKMSSIIDYTDRATCIIFGDGCGAVLLEPNTEGLGIIDSILRADGSGCQYLHQKAGGSMRPSTEHTVERKEHFVHQEGKAVFKFAVTNMADVSAEIMQKNALTSDDIAWLVPHQANLRIIEAMGRKLDLPLDRVVVTVDRHANTSAASIPLALAVATRDGRIRRDELVLMEAIGGGLTWGAALARF